jgi:hypothetical protein
MNHSPIARCWLRCRELQLGLLFFLMQASISVIFTSTLLAQQKTANSEINQRKTYRDAEAYKIYSVLLGAESDSQLVVEANTRFFYKATPDNLDIKGDLHFEKLWGPVLNDFAAKYRTPMSLTESIPLTPSYVVVSEHALNSIFRDGGGWNRFSELYPHAHGVYSFSPVGFDQRKTRAIVWMNFACGQLCNYGTYHFLEKSGGKWREVKVEARFTVLVS